MVQGRYKSRTFRKVKVKTATGVNVQYRLRKPKAARCAICHSVLKGTPRQRPVKMKNMPKSSKRPERPYGGVLCSKCTREQIKMQTRG